jgi:hypothetical protein
MHVYRHANKLFTRCIRWNARRRHHLWRGVSVDWFK